MLLKKRKLLKIPLKQAQQELENFQVSHNKTHTIIDIVLS